MTNQHLNSTNTNPPPPRLSDDTEAQAGRHRLADPQHGRADTSHDRARLEHSKPETALRPSRTALECRRSEQGFTLQTLIILAIFVVLATVAGIVIVAITTSGNEDLEASGSTDLGENCQPHEVRDQALESMGISGTHAHLDQYQSETIGCKPYCGTWEYYSKGQNANGAYEYDPDAALGATIGGPEGAGGVYSSNTGCFAPCYWGFPGISSGFRPRPEIMSDGRVNLRYFDDNRAPEPGQIRLGVNYYRAHSSADPTLITNPNHFWNHTDLQSATRKETLDGKHTMFFRSATSPNHHGNISYPGTHPIPSEILASGVPYVFIPNFPSGKKNPPRVDPSIASGDLTSRNTNDWIDENWEWRADPINRTCTVVNVTQNDRIVCSSEWENCNTPS